MAWPAKRPCQWLRGLVLLLAAAAMPGALPALAQTPEAVVLRAWDHGDYGRIVFNWPAPVGYQARLDGTSLEVVFDRPLIPSFTSVFQQLGDYVSSAGMAGDNRTVRFDVNGAYRLRDFATDRRVVVDLIRTDATAGDPAPAAAGLIRLPVRFGIHPDYNRVVFDWTEPVTYRVDQGGSAATVRFERQAVIDDQAAQAALPPLIESFSSRIEAGGLAVRIGLANGVRVRDFRLGNRIVVDVLPAVPQSPADGAAADDAIPAPPAAPVTAEEDAPGPAAPTDPNPEAPQTTTQPAPASPVAPPQQAVRDDEATAPAEPGTAAAPADAEDAEDAAAATAPDEETAEAEPDTSGSAAERDAAGSLDDGVMVVGAARRPDGIRLRFDWDVPVSSAVYMSGGALWVLFDAPVTLDFARVDETGAADQAEQVPLAGATIARLMLSGAFTPVVSRVGTAWVVDLSRGRRQVDQIPIVLEDQSDVGARILLTSTEPGAEIAILDPELGETLIVVPLPEPGQGVSPGRRFVDLELLATAQGVVVRPISDEVAVRSLRDGVEITSLSGLNLSPREDRVGMRPVAADPVEETAPEQAQPAVMSLPEPEREGEDQPLFDFADWRRADGRSFRDSQQLLNINLSRAPAETRNDARLDLARFYFANAMAAETLGWIGQILSDSPWMERDPGLRAMRAASNVLMERYSEASGDLFDERFDGSSEMALWRGIYLTETGNPEAANEELIKGSRIIERYPRRLRSKARLTVARNALDMGQIDRALSILDTVLVDRPTERAVERVNYFKGLATAQAGRPLEAIEMLEAAAQSGDRQTRAEAGRDLAELKLEQGMIGPAEAAEELEDLRFAWRGDSFELSLLKRLGDLHIEAGDYEKGLTTYREAISIFPDSQAVREIAQTMNETFKDLFLGGQADALAPVTALGIYYNFRELTPVGNLGDQMIFRLADRLVGVDLLAQAADLLQHQIEFRLRGNELARVGARLAEIYLLDDKPAEAIKALRASDIVRMSDELADQRRYLMARAHLKNRQYDKALALLEGDNSWDADFLRADVYWAQQDFLAEATVLDRIFADRSLTEPLTPAEESALMKFSVSLALANNRSALARLRDRFGPLMDQTGSRDAFRALASYVDSGPIDPAELTSTVQEINNFEAYMASLRERVTDDNLSAIN